MNIEFKKGVYDFNEQSNFNFQLNRLVMWDGGDLEEVKKVGPTIKTSEDWKRELIALGDKAVAEGRTENAIAYYRMSEFFMYDGDPDKKKYYKMATDMFYDFFEPYFITDEDGNKLTGKKLTDKKQVKGSETPGLVERFKVKYEDVYLPVMHVEAQGEKKDTILLHGGNDSYFEEFFYPMLYLAENGFEVYLFEGPGQGGVMRAQGKHFTYMWEKPVKAVLDYFNLDDVTIIGASLGGMLAPRAAAFDERIQRVIAWSIFPNFLDILLASSVGYGSGLMKVAKWLINHKCRFIVNRIFEKKAKSDELTRWGLEHGKYAYEAKDAFDYATNMKNYQVMDIAHQLTQDILVVGASRDHFIPWQMCAEELPAFTNARSVTFRLFTDKEDACNHCNCGNVKLTFDTFMNWITECKRDSRF